MMARAKKERNRLIDSRRHREVEWGSRREKREERQLPLETVD